MVAHPRASYLEAAQRVLARDAMAAEVVTAAPVGLLGKAMGAASARASSHALALRVAAAIADGPSRAWLRALATDRSRSAPVQATQDHLRGCGGPRYHPDEAEALSSVRVLALGLLEDRDLLRAVAADSSDDAFVRRWAGEMLRAGDPAQPHRPFPKRVKDNGDDDAPSVAFSPCSF